MMATFPWRRASMARHLEYGSPIGNIPMAVSTTAGCPMASRAELSASEFITVASIPIWSPFTRSNPFEAPLSPLKILPPPMTMATSTPLSTACLIWAAYDASRWLSIPYPCSPISDSPESFNNILLNLISKVSFKILQIYSFFPTHKRGIPFFIFRLPSFKWHTPGDPTSAIRRPPRHEGKTTAATHPGLRSK